MTEHRNKRIIASYMAGANIYQVADQFGISKSRVSQIVRRAGVSRRQGGKGRKPIVWPTCPDHLMDDYKTLCRYMKAAEARKTLEAQL